MIPNLMLGDNKSPQVSRTLLSILADLNYAVVSINVTFMFRCCFLSSLARS